MNPLEPVTRQFRFDPEREIQALERLSTLCSDLDHELAGILAPEQHEKRLGKSLDALHDVVAEFAC